jgi:hypothetical protein
MKHLLALILAATLSLPTFAKEVGETVGTSGKLVLHDTPCKLVPLGNHFQAVDKDGQPAFTGCWLVQDGVVYLVDEKGSQFATEATNFTWFYDDKKKI